MNKYDTMLDIVEHPDQYTSEQIDRILSDADAREIYNLLCKVKSSLDVDEEQPNVEAEWESFTRQHLKPKFRFLWIGNRAASIAALAITSIAALAIGIAVTVNLTRHNLKPKTAETTSSSTAIVQTDTITSANDSIRPVSTPILFEYESLETVLKTVAENYELVVRYKTPSAARLHLYYKLDPAMPLEEIVEQLNTFEQINIRIDGNTLIVD